MAEPKKLTTEEILAMARKKKADAATAAAAESSSEPAVTPESSSPSPVEASPPAEKAAAPKSTADILAAARAAKAGGAAKPAPAAGDKPKSTADILAAARAAKGTAPAASAGDKPKSTADILAAARAGKAAAAAPASKPAAAAKASAPVASAPATGDKPALKDMVAVVKAANEGKPVSAPKLPVAAKPKLPAKSQPVSRRASFGMLLGVMLAPFTMAWAAMAAVAGLWGLGTARFMMPNMVLELPSKFKVGPPSDFPPGVVSEKYKASRGVWIIHSTQYDGRDLIYALLSICTHLGCTPNWLEGEQKFKCPCHGSGFYITGINFEGPAPRPLERVGLRRSEDGSLEVDKSIKFQEELGQWSDTKSFYQIS